MFFSPDPSSCRVDFFTRSGRYHSTEAVKMNHYEGPLLNQAFADALANHLVVIHSSTVPGRRRTVEIRLVDMTAVCIHPNHKHAIPLMMRVEDAIRFPSVVNFYPELAGFADELQKRRDAIKAGEVHTWPNNVTVLNAEGDNLEDWAAPWREGDDK